MSIVDTLLRTDDKRSIHLALALAKLLEHRPSVAACEDEWVLAVDTVATQLITQLGRRDGISVALESLASMHSEEATVRAILPAEFQGKHTNVWLDLLQWATLHQNSVVSLRAINDNLATQLNGERVNRQRLEREVQRLQDELARYPTRVKLLDLGDEPV